MHYQASVLSTLWKQYKSKRRRARCGRSSLDRVELAISWSPRSSIGETLRPGKSRSTNLARPAPPSLTLSLFTALVSQLDRIIRGSRPITPLQRVSVSGKVDQLPRATHLKGMPLIFQGCERSSCKGRYIPATQCDYLSCGRQQWRSRSSRYGPIGDLPIEDVLWMEQYPGKLVQWFKSVSELLIALLNWSTYQGFLSLSFHYDSD